MSARDVAFTLMALGHVAGCRGKSDAEILAEAVGEIVRLQTALQTIASGTADKIPPYTCAPREVLQKIAAKALEGK